MLQIVNKVRRLLGLEDDKCEYMYFHDHSYFIRSPHLPCCLPDTTEFNTLADSGMEVCMTIMEKKYYGEENDMC